MTWRHGFLAALYDECGAFERGCVRLHPSDTTAVGLAHASLQLLGFDVRVAHGSGIVIRGDLRDQLRFVHSVEPSDPRVHLDDEYVETTADTKIVPTMA